MAADFQCQVLSAQDSSDKIVKEIKNSNLHFILNETPFSVYVTIREKFLTGMKICEQISDEHDNMNELVNEHASQKADIKRTESQKQDQIDTILNLETLLDKA